MIRKQEHFTQPEHQKQNELAECYNYANKILLGIIKELETLSGDALIERAKKYKGVVNMMKDIVSTFTKAKRIMMLEQKQIIDVEKEKAKFNANVARIQNMSATVIAEAKQ